MEKCTLDTAFFSRPEILTFFVYDYTLPRGVHFTFDYTRCTFDCENVVIFQSNLDSNSDFVPLLKSFYMLFWVLLIWFGMCELADNVTNRFDQILMFMRIVTGIHFQMMYNAKIGCYRRIWKH